MFPKEVIMPKMTEEEAEALDEFVTKYPPKVDPSKARYPSRMVALDDLSANYIISISTANQKPLRRSSANWYVKK